MYLRLLTFVLLVGQSLGALAQNKLYLPNIKYTATGITAFNQVCYQANGIQFWVNNTQWIKDVDYFEEFSAFGISKINFPFGKLKPGDTFEVRDACGSMAASRVVEDDYVYVEVPNGNSYSGNGIGSTDESAPYGRLSSQVSVGKCEGVSINAHGLHKYFINLGTSTFGTSYITGKFLINGSPLNSGIVGADLNGSSDPITYTINSDGSITYNGGVTFSSYANFSGRSPFSLEYQHNGVLPFDVQEVTIGAIGFRMLNNNTVNVKEHTYSGTIESTITGSFASSIFKITYDGAYFKFYIDNVLRKTVARSVIYTSSSGGISNGSILPYGTGVTWQPSNSGSQWVGVIVDGVLNTRQQFYVSEDLSISESVINVACNGNSTGRITIDATGGKAPFNYSKDGWTFQNSNVFDGLSAGNYNIKVRDASGCETSKNISVSENPPLSFSTNNKNNANCLGESNGAITFNASGGIGTFQYAINNNNYQTSNSFLNLGASDYTFWVKDGAGCTKTLNETIGTNSIIVATIGSQQNVSCFGGNDGSVSLSTTGSVPSGTLQYSLNSINYQTSSAFSNLHSNNYTINIKDNICSTNVNVSISQASPLNADATITKHVSCFGGSNGEIIVSSQGGTSPYQYSADGISYMSSATFSSLPIGNYKFWVKDSKGCIKETTIYTISQPTQLTHSVAAKIDVLCFNGNNGEVTLAATGGLTPYSYSLDGSNFQTSNSFSGLTAGEKTFIVKDANACLKTVATSILQPTAFSITAIHQNLVCNQDNTGFVQLAGTGGILPYVYNKNGETFQSSDTFGSLAAGEYVFSAKDAHNCSFILNSITLTQPSPIVITHTKKLDVDCEYYQKGELNFSASGSNSGFNFTLNGTNLSLSPIVAITRSDGVFKDLPVGNYTITATDQRGCSKDYTASIVPKNSSIRFTLDKELPTSCLSNDGKVIVTGVSGGRPNYSYRISSQTNFTSNNTFGDLSNGNYIITVADELCSYNQTIDLRLPNSLNADYKITPLNCETPNANVLIDPISGGNGTSMNGNYELNLYGSFSNNRDFTNLKPNSYTVLIKDSPFSCQTAISFEVKEQNRADLKVNFLQNISCFEGSDGIIQVKGDNNVGPFTYSFQNQSNFSSNPQFGDLSIGTYKIYAQNAMGCRDTIRVTLTQPTKIEWNVTTRNNDCFGDQTGEISFFSTGGTPPYKYSISENFIESSTFKQLSAGKYISRIKDSKQCEFSKEVELIQPPELKLKPIYQDTIRCFGENNGSIYIEATGGTPSYVYSINNGGIYVDTPIFKDLREGTYPFFVKDSKQCLKKTELTITEPDALKLSLVSQTNPLCAGEKNGKIEIVAKGGNNGGYNYVRDNVIKQSTGIFEGLSEGTYTFKVSDRKGCNDTISSVKLTWPKPLRSVIEKITTPSCMGDANGQISVSLDGGILPYKAYFNEPNSTQKLIENNQVTFSELISGVYQVRLADANGCMIQTTVKVPVPESLNPIVFTALPKDVCKGQQVVLNANNSKRIIQWYLDDIAIPDTKIVSNEMQFSKDYQELTTSKVGKYTVSAKNLTGCEVKGSYDLVNNDKALIADFLLPVQVFVGDEVVAMDITKPIPDRVIWTLPEVADKMEENIKRIRFTMVNEGKYVVQMQAFLGDCITIVKHDIEVFKPEDIDKTDPKLGYDKTQLINKVSVSPNPNYGKFAVTADLFRAKPIEVSIVRASSGQTVYSTTFPEAKKQHIFDLDLKVKTDNYLLIIKTEDSINQTRIAIID
ncbi:SprB repeat-containing protein [Emticicia sp. SJ17W-69]|uniref:SprB repeat-containing protein n=1 Tax=Emticicia sp. SJ17W-69 TaxID=3421657 RepID=UPI003EBD1217